MIKEVSLMGPHPGHHLLTLTDEELAALGPGSRALVPLPYLETLSQVARDAAVDTAKRSLLAGGQLRLASTDRGARSNLLTVAASPSIGVAPAPTDDVADGVDDGVVSSAVADELLTALCLVRDNAPVVLGVIRSTGSGPPLSRYLHATTEAVLVEDVTLDGVHRFAVLDPGQVPRVMQGFLVPPDAQDGLDRISLELNDLLSESVSDAALEQFDRLGRATVTVDIIVRRVGDGVDQDHPPELTGLFLGPAGCHVTSSRVGCSHAVELVPIAAGSVGAFVAALLGPQICRPEGAPDVPGQPSVTSAAGSRS